MHNMQVLCLYLYVKDRMKAMLHWQMCDLISQILPFTIKFILGSTYKIWAQWIDSKTIDFYCYFASNKNMVVQ